MIGNLARCVIIPLVVSLVCSGCYHWVPIEPNFANREPRTLDVVRMGDGTVAESVSIRWPLMNMIKDGKVVTLDLRDKPVSSLEFQPGKTAGLVVGLSLGLATVVGLGYVAAVFGRASLPIR